MQAKVKWWLSISLLCLFYGVTLIVNFSRVPATYGYDWPGHFTYLYYVADHGAPPPAGASAEFFNPPLYYFSVVAFQRVTGIPLARAGQTFNLVLAATTLVILIKLCRKVWEDDKLPALWMVGLYVFNPVIYRTFGMVRPEAMLLPLFTAAMYFVALAQVRGSRVGLWMIGSGILSGLVFGVRQWGAFLEATFFLWWLLMAWPALRSPTRRWAALRTLSVQPITFLAMVGLYLLIRGENLFAFNTQPKPFDIAFLTNLNLPLLFSSPVRPALDYSFWPIMYADFWGDYWRYWREALWHDPLPTSPATLAALARSMWAALPASAMMIAGLFLKFKPSEDESTMPDRIYQFARILVVVSFAGFLLFATIYAPVGKGDTAKSVYLVYQVPFWGYMAAETALRLRRRTKPNPDKPELSRAYLHGKSLLKVQELTRLGPNPDKPELSRAYLHGKPLLKAQELTRLGPNPDKPELSRAYLHGRPLLKAQELTRLGPNPDKPELSRAYLHGKPLLKVQELTRLGPKLTWVYMLPLLLIVGFVSPNCFYRAPDQMVSRTWNMPDARYTTEVTLGGGITLVGYDVVVSADLAQWDVTLIWRSDAYTRMGHKVFVHLLGADGEVLAQSDAIPAAWQRPTYAWMLGEYITDVHHLSIQAHEPASKLILNVGLYRESDGQRLLTSAGEGYITLDLSAISGVEEVQPD